MVKVRLTRMGAKKKPFYRIVVSNSCSPRDGSFIEQIGFYNPITNPAVIQIEKDRMEYWLGVGAQPTPTVSRLILKQKSAEPPKN